MSVDVNWEREVAANAACHRALHERVEQLSVTETSEDGMVKVTVSAGGALTDLVLRDRWQPPAMPDLAAQIMDCLRRAQARIPDLLGQAMFEIVGPGDPSAHLLLDEVRRRFGEPVPVTEPEPDLVEIWIERTEPEPAPDPPGPRMPPPTRARQASGAPDREDDWDERSIMEEQ